MVRKDFFIAKRELKQCWNYKNSLILKVIEDIDIVTKNRKKNGIALNTPQIDEDSLFVRISKIIEKRKHRAGTYVNREIALMYWEIGQHIGSVLLGGERAEYGKRIVATLSQQLTERYGSSFDKPQISRMIKFAKIFPDSKIVVTLSQQLSWSHIMRLS